MYAYERGSVSTVVSLNRNVSFFLSLSLHVYLSSPPFFSRSLLGQYSEKHCGLSRLRGPSAGAISGVQSSSVRGERRSVG